MRLFIITFAFFTVTYAELKKPIELLFYSEPQNSLELFESFKAEYGRNYAEEENSRRYGIFRENLMRARLYQSLEQGTAEYGITQFSDMTANEFLTRFANAKFEPRHPFLRAVTEYPGEHLPEKVDWRTEGAVTSVKNQGACGSCWAFYAVGNIEGQWFRRTGKLVALSEQQLIDCDTEDDGCDGGLPSLAYEQVKSMGGIENEVSYPYMADEDTCRMDPLKFVAYINGSVQLSTNETEQAIWLAKYGPISVGVNAAPFQFYRGGISRLDATLCPPKLNHGVLTVGYGIENGQPYWLVKNSWGLNWGEQGYFRLYRGAGICGINLCATSAVIY